MSVDLEDAREAEDAAIKAQERFESCNTDDNREAFHLANANLLKACKTEENYWAQKANIKWLASGDASTKYFQSLVKGKRRQASIRELKDHLGKCITTLPLEEEIKAAIWQLNPNSSAGPDGYNGEFFRHFWDIIKADLISATHEYFQGIPIPMAFGSTNITLIPKVEGAREIGDYRPIALSTFFSKMLSRIMANRLGPMLNKIISPEQAGFQKREGIEEHILLTNELMHNLDSKVRGGNVMIKLDMAKAFDKISWNFLQAILQAFGFNEQSICLLLQNLRATYMSVLVNGKPNGFFKIKRGVKQGDPLSPLLFIIGSEGFARSLNHAINSGYISPYKVGKTRVVSHLAFADDLIIFLKGDLRNILRFRHLLDSYLKASGQEVNKKKSRIFCKKGSRGLYTSKLDDTLGFKVGNPPFKYLGSTITQGKLKKTHCDHILHHFDAYINNWYSKELNPMSRLILIKHVLSAIPMHTLAVQDLPKSIIRTIHGKLANFFWGSKQGRNHYHWAKWGTLTRPTGEGGLGIRNLEDIQKASALKLWWKSLTGNSLWARFMKNKYAREGTFEAKIYDSASWKRICRISPIGLQFTTITNQNVC
ncbi:unnamed protein product [Cuscuta campestris]|uniref:Reverse transcriptase domain-containing protein n=1 Tax=Cuscuta campestris TaxID=132261 RepID=A0A484MAJ8_9ASTE|nr:unnamed protein product [Cuscuta campestris]